VRRPLFALPLAVSPLALLLACGMPGPAPSALPPASSASASTSASASASTSASVLAGPRPPATPKKPVSTTYHGVTVVDDYRWLEDPSDPAVKAWGDAQRAYARAVLDAIPSRPAVRARVEQIMTAVGGATFAMQQKHGVLFALRDQPPKQQPYLVTVGSVDDAKSERTLVDPNALDPSGKTAIDWFVPSDDGALVAVSMSEGGSESGTLHVFEVATGKERKGDVIPRVNGGTAGGSVAWRKDGKGFWYTRYPRKGERADVDLDFYQQVWFHALGTPEAKDAYSIGKDFPRIAEIALHASHDGRFVLASVAHGDGGDFEHWVLEAGAKKPTWGRIADVADRVRAATFGLDGALYLVSRKDAPRGRLLRVAPKDVAARPLVAAARELVAQSTAKIEEVAITRGAIYLAEQIGGPSRLRAFDLAGKPLGEVPLPAVSAVAELVPVADASDELLLRSRSYVRPSRWLRWDPKKKALAETALKTTYTTKLPELEVGRETAVSKDGTQVPLNVVRLAGAPRDGNAMTILYGYGGYGVSEEPVFRDDVIPFLEQGGVFVVANLRGGGEFGEEWHQAGMLTKKQNVFDDFTAAALYLVDAKITRPGRLAILGGSNGGLLMGAAMTQHPELYAAVVSYVGIYDMLRVEDTPNGAFNVTEFGTVKEPAQFEALYKYSPYHHVRDGQKYPPVMFLTGENDPRVEPWHSRKMTARLQAAQGSPEGKGGLVLLRTNADTGHGIGSPLSAQIEEGADVYAFLFQQLGHAYVAQK
jgi:prolyl oligopeptidase